jgi:hypothetical protein
MSKRGNPRSFFSSHTFTSSYFLSYAQKSIPALVNTTTFVVIVSVLVAIVELIATAAGRLYYAHRLRHQEK